MNARQNYLLGYLGNFTAMELLFGKGNATEQDNQSLFLQFQDFMSSQADLFKLPSVLSTYFTYL